MGWSAERSVASRCRIFKGLSMAHLKTIMYHLVERKQIDDAGERGNSARGQ